MLPSAKQTEGESFASKRALSSFAFSAAFPPLRDCELFVTPVVPSLGVGNAGSWQRADLQRHGLRIPRGGVQTRLASPINSGDTLTKRQIIEDQIIEEQIIEVQIIEEMGMESPYKG